MSRVLQTKTLSNPLDEVFIFKWDGNPYSVDAKSTAIMPDFIAVHGARHLADVILRNKGRMKDLMKDGQRVARPLGGTERQHVMAALLDREDHIMDLDEVVDSAAKSAGDAVVLEKGKAAMQKTISKIEVVSKKDEEAIAPHGDTGVATPSVVGDDSEVKAAAAKAEELEQVKEELRQAKEELENPKDKEEVKEDPDAKRIAALRKEYEEMKAKKAWLKAETKDRYAELKKIFN